MKYIKRWSLMYSSKEENIMEHSEQVAQIAHALALINNIVFGGSANPDRCVTLAVFHECSEVITGDLPTPIKYYNSEINKAYKSLESIANDKLLAMLPDKFRDVYKEVLSPDKESYEWKLVKAADRLSALVKCIEERKGGNKEFLKAENSIRESISASPLPETGWFAENFLAAYEKTLDELE